MGPFFPAEYSTLSSTALAEMIEQKYGWTKVRCRFLVRGVGDTYLVETANKSYILRIYRSSHRTLPQINAEIDLLTAAKHAHVAVSYPLQDQDGHTIQVLKAIEGPRYAVIFTYAPGAAAKVLTNEQLTALGREMAKFHSVSETTHVGARWIYNPETTMHGPLQKLKPYFAGLPEEYQWLQETVAQVTARLEQKDESTIAKGYCQFDFLPKNFHFENDHITLFDFDFMGYGWLVNDLMTFWQHLQLDVYATRMKQEEADRQFAVFLAAYRQERPMPDEHLTLMPDLTLGFWLFYMGFHTTHEQFFPALQPATLKAYTGFLKNLLK